MKILVTGSKGQLGWELIRKSSDFDFEILGTDRFQLDITRQNQIESFFTQFQPDLVINAAAYTNVDAAESDPKTAFAVNKTGPSNLAKVCEKYAVPLIHVSTDYVFDGQKGSPYLETDPVSPLGVYGKSKEEGENEIRLHIKAHVIIRTAWLYGAYGHNFVKTMLRLGREKNGIIVVDDQYGSPTSASDLAEAVLTISKQIQDGLDVKWGTYHYCGKGITTWHGFAEKIFETAKKYGPLKITNIKPVTTTEYPTQTKRPEFSALDCTLIEKNFSINPKPWEDSLKVVIDRVLGNTD
ncbi:MAG: dTDP-4-dehydrorhamnose reductase [Deltaproteobacteria bacterium]|nr:dTDP-4-dehydrorhamnose reductase [Deltaproteobacteria bacterium]